MSDSPRLVLCRHGATELNRSVAGASAERVRGWLDVPLDTEGKAEAKELAARVQSFPVERVYCSTLVRAEETAHAIADAVGRAPPILTRGLLPWNVGEMAGEPVREMLPKMKLLSTLHTDRPAPGGESFGEFGRRYLGELVKLLAECKRDGVTLCAVSHTRNLQLTKAWLAAGSKGDLSYDPDVMNDYEHEVGTGGVMVLEAP